MMPLFYIIVTFIVSGNPATVVVPNNAANIDACNTAARTYLNRQPAVGTPLTVTAYCIPAK